MTRARSGERANAKRGPLSYTKEMFVQNLARISLVESKDKSNVQYGDLAEVVNSDDTLQFLQDIIPKKILAKEYFDTLSKLTEEES